MKPASAIRHFLNKGPVCSLTLLYTPVSMTEIKEFKNSCSSEEWIEHAKVSCELIGETYEPAEAGGI